MSVALVIRHIPNGCENSVVLGIFLMDLTHLCCEILILECVLPSHTTNFIKFVNECYMFRCYRIPSGIYLTYREQRDTRNWSEINRFS